MTLAFEVYPTLSHGILEEETKAGPLGSGIPEASDQSTA